MVVVLPVPFTPTTKITRGAAVALASKPFELIDGAVRIFRIWFFSSRFSEPGSSSLCSFTCWRSPARTSLVVCTPISALSSADSSCRSSSGSTGRSPVRICSTRAASSVRVLLTESFKRSSSVGSGGPKREIMGVWSSKVVARFCPEPSIVAKSGEGKKSAALRQLNAESYY